MKLKSLLWSSVLKKIALEVQDIRELGLGWAWFMNDLRAFLPACQEMELASPSIEEPVTQIEADVPIEPLALQADATNLDLAKGSVRIWESWQKRSSKRTGGSTYH